MTSGNLPRTTQKSSLWEFRDARVRHEPMTVEHGKRWVVYDPADQSIIAVRYSSEQAHALADGYALGSRASRRDG